MASLKQGLVVVGGTGLFLALAVGAYWYGSNQTPQAKQDGERPPIIVTDGGSIRLQVDAPNNRGKFTEDKPFNWHHEHDKAEPKKFWVDISGSTDCVSTLYAAQDLEVKYGDGAQFRTTLIYIGYPDNQTSTRKALIIDTQREVASQISDYEIHLGEPGWYVNTVTFDKKINSKPTTCTFPAVVSPVPPPPIPPLPVPVYIKIYQKK